MFSDLLVLAACIKLLWDAVVVAKTLEWEWFAIGMVGLPFLLGIGGKSANKAIKDGVAIASLLIFFSILSISGLQSLFVALLGLGLLLYLFGRFAKRMFSSILIAFAVIALIIYFLVS